MSVTSDFGGRLPHNLRKVTPSLEVAHVGLGTVSRVKHHLVVVHLIGDHLVDLITWSSCTDVLTITSTTGLSVVSVLAARRNLGCYVRQVVIP